LVDPFFLLFAFADRLTPNIGIRALMNLFYHNSPSRTTARQRAKNLQSPAGKLIIDRQGEAA